ncbi:glycosyltransferase family 2 protein [Lacisediminihabitans profunda]|uniref:glycosyltransferase family 2 protein n=1 Tax=Lacisediminihabitans profunda TaxID=2594790 RepID=UPI00164FCB05|nr:glycosyltransferase family 2 protein [Lacisediminihabitans profunda]
MITVSFGSDAVLPGFLASISASSARQLRVIVADNKADDGSISTLVRRAGFDYLPMTGNLGYGAAINAAVATLPAEIEWLVIGNPDITIDTGAIDTLIARAESNPRIALVGPRIVDEAGVIYPSARSIPSLRTGVGHALFANIWPTNPWSSAYHNDRTEMLKARTSGWLSGAFFLARRSAFEQLGGFDEHFFMYFEDVDLGYRMGKAGWLCVYEPAATVVHSGAHSTATDSSAMVREHHLSARKFLMRKYSGWALWPVRVALRAGLWTRLAVVRLRRSRSGPSVH